MGGAGRRRSFDTVVVGLGAMGSAALYHLAHRGHTVLGIEQFVPGHDRGSSHGESRVIRLGYAEKPFYVPLARAAFEDWRALCHESGEDVLVETGMIEAGRPGSAAVEGPRLACDQHGLDYDLLTAAEVNAAYPAFDLPEDFVAIRQPRRHAGFVRADRASRLHRQAAEEAGAVLLTNCAVRAIEPASSCLRIVLADGGIVEAGSVVVCAGAWVNRLLPGAGLPLTLTRQVLCWFEPGRPETVRLGGFPVFYVEGDEDGVYGFPYLPGHGLKCASHLPGRVLETADAASQDAGVADGEAIGRFLRRYLPGAAGRLIGMKTCIYANAPDGDFIIDRHPQDRRIVVVSACSGHGFKFSGVIGSIAADLAAGGATGHDISHFRIDRFPPSG